MIVGRFAPSPTGPLHMGSLVTALASYLDIKQRGGEWFVRFDDIDPPRQDPDAIEHILTALHAHGLASDRAVDYQSNHSQRYEAALTKLQSQCFHCSCSRRSLAGIRVYPGICRNETEPRPDTALRLRMPDREVGVDDGILGLTTFNLAEAFGDTIIRRRDGLWAYHLATAVDDGNDVTHVMRGQDLFETTPIHVYLMELLNLPVPVYSHLPLLRFDDGSKLSKQTHAPAVDNTCAANNLRHVLTLLGQNPPAEPDWSVGQWLSWGTTAWQVEKVPPTLANFTKKP